MSSVENKQYNLHLSPRMQRTQDDILFAEDEKNMLKRITQFTLLPFYITICEFVSFI